MQTVIDDLLAQSAQVEKQLQDNLSILTGRDDLSEKAIVEARKMFQDNYRATVANLQDQARVRLEMERAKMTLALAAAKRKEVERTRSILGDQVVARIYERRLESMPADDIRRFYEEGAEGFEKELVAGLGRAILEERAARDPSSPTNYIALQTLATPSGELGELQRREFDLRQSEGLVAELDPITWRRDTADRLGVDPRFIEPTSRTA